MGEDSRGRRGRGGGATTAQVPRERQREERGGDEKGGGEEGRGRVGGLQQEQ